MHRREQVRPAEDRTLLQCQCIAGNMTSSLLADRNASLVGDLERVQALRHHLLVLGLAVRREEVFERRPDHDSVARQRRRQEDAFLRHPRNFRLDLCRPGGSEIQLTARRCRD